MYYFVVQFLKPSETSVLPWLRVSVDFRVMKCSFLEKDSRDTDPSRQPKVFGDLRKWHVVALKDVRLRPMCWSLRPVSKKKITIKTVLQLCSAVWHVTSSTPPRMWILEDSFWNSKSQQWRERLWSGRNTVGWMWAKADPTIIQFLLNIAGFTNLGGVPASLLLQRWLIYFKPIDYILRQPPCRHLKFFSFNPNGAEGNPTDSGKKM